MNKETLIKGTTTTYEADQCDQPCCDELEKTRDGVVRVPIFDPESETIKKHNIELKPDDVRIVDANFGNDKPKFWTKAEVIELIDQRLEERNVQTFEFKGARDL